jgi:ComF family protein
MAAKVKPIRPTFPQFKAPSGLRAALGAGLDLILPPETLDGGLAPMSSGSMSSGLSAEGWSRIAFLDDPVCDGCGLPFPYDLGADDHGRPARCAGCMARPRAFSRARAACLYDEHSRDLILRLKHADRPELGKLFARWLSRASAPLLAEADALVPVPLHRARLFSRRYNQAAEIARPLARLSGLAYLPDALVRGRATASQGGKSGRGRRLNVKGAFVVPPRQRAHIAGKRLLLVDDVLTTGATAEACAKALLEAGAACVALAVVARVREAEAAPI